MSVAPHVASYPDGDHIVERFMPPPRRSGVFHQDRMNVHQMKLKPPHVDHNLQFAIRSYRGELAWRDCRLATQMNRGGSAPLPAYKRFYARSSRSEMAPFIPPPPPEGLIPVVVRNNTTIPTRIKIYHQHMLQPPEGPGFVQVLLSAGQSQPVKVPGLSGHGIDPRTGCNRLVKMLFTVQFEQSGASQSSGDAIPGGGSMTADFTAVVEGTFGWREGDPEEPVAMVERKIGSHQLPCFQFFATMEEAITVMQAAPK